LSNKQIRKIIHYGLLIIIILYVITGFGITRNNIIGPITFELLSKANATILHSYLIYPLVAFLYLHILLTIKKRKK